MSLKSFTLLCSSFVCSFIIQSTYHSFFASPLTMRTYTELYSVISKLIQRCCLATYHSNGITASALEQLSFNYRRNAACARINKMLPIMKILLPADKQAIYNKREKNYIKFLKMKFNKGDVLAMNSTYCPISMIDATPRWEILNHSIWFIGIEVQKDISTASA